VRNRAAWIAGAVGAAGVAYRALRRRRSDLDHKAPDPRADELRRKLDDSKQLVEERDQFESGETAVDEVEAPTLEGKRAAVHERGREAAREMRGPSPEN
jgi:hypothetical protein